MITPHARERELEAGQELDLLVMIEVLGFTEDLRYGRLLAPQGWAHAWDGRDAPLPLSTDLGITFLVVEKMRADGWRFEAMESEANADSDTGFAFGDQCCRATFSKHAFRQFSMRRIAEHRANAPTLPLAICRAALLASRRPPKTEER